MRIVVRAISGSRAPWPAFAAVVIYSVKESDQRAAYGSPEKNTTMRTSHSNVRSLRVKRAVVACTANVDSSVFRSVRGTRRPATIHSLTHHSSGMPDGAP